MDARRPAARSCIRLVDHIRRVEANRLRDQGAGHAGDGSLPGRVDIHHHHSVGSAEGLSHFRGEGSGPAVEVGLEADQHAASMGELTRGLEVTDDLRRVMGIAVIDAHLCARALQLHAPSGAPEVGEPTGEAVEGMAELEPAASAASASTT